MTQVPTLTMLAAWLRPVLATLDDETVDRCRSWVTALAEAEDVSIEDLALAAFEKASVEEIGSLEARLAELAHTYAPEGKAQLIAHLAAAALLYLVDDEDDTAVAVACRCESLLFLGWEPVIEDLPVRIHAFASNRSRAVRERVPLDATLKAPRKKPVGSDAEADEVTKLAVGLSETQSLVTRIADRMESVVSQFNSRLELIDEEVDALWWARSDRSATTGQAWADLEPLQRAVLAGVEVTAIVGPHPPTSATLTVLSQVIGSASNTFTLIEVLEALQQSDWSGSAAGDSSAPFRPLSAGLALMKQFDNDLTVVEAALKSSLSLPDAHHVTVTAVARQMLNEYALRNADD